MKQRAQRAKYERPLPLKVVGSLFFGFLGFWFIQAPLINPLSQHMSTFMAYAVAYVVSGQIVFLLDYFVARHQCTTGHLRDISWHDFWVAWRRHTATSFVGAGINAKYLTDWHPGKSKWDVLIANGVSAIVTQTVKWTYSHRPRHKRMVRREE